MEAEVTHKSVTKNEFGKKIESKALKNSPIYEKIDNIY